MSANSNEEDSLATQVWELIEQRRRAKEEEEYVAWCDRFASVPADLKWIPKEGFLVDMELQPWRWIQHGLDLIGSRRASGTIQLMGGQEGADLRSFLPYPVFQMGAEVLLKGMWLYQFADCRKCEDYTYVEPSVRSDYFLKIKGLSKTHDVLEVIEKVKAIDAYVEDGELNRFLVILSGIARQFYLPVANWRWADERYPKRFYNDSSKRGKADAYKSYPEQRPIARLFAEAAERLERVWKMYGESPD